MREMEKFQVEKNYQIEKLTYKSSERGRTEFEKGVK